jgi:hypothetical protein
MNRNTTLLGLALTLALGLLAPATHAQTRAWQWGFQTLNPTPTNGSEARSRAIATDAAGNVYTCGELREDSGTSAPGVRVFGSTTLSTAGAGFSSGFVAQLSAAGQWQWAIGITAVAANASGDQYAFVDNVVVSPNGDVYVSGDVNGTALRVGGTTQAVANANGAGAFVARISSTGQCQWIQVYGHDDVSVEDIAFDPTSGGVVVAGSYEAPAVVLGSTTLAAPATAGEEAAFVARLSPSGFWTAALPVRTTGSGTANVGLPTVGPQGQVAIAVYVSNGSATLGGLTLTSPSASSANEKLVVAQLSPANQWQWLAQTTSGAAFGTHQLKYDGSGNLWVAGESDPGMQFGTFTLPAAATGFVARLSAAGQWNLLGSITETIQGGVDTRNLAVDPRGNAVLVGSLAGGQGNSYSYGLGSTTFTVNGFSQNFVARFNTAGRWDYAQLFPAINTTATSRDYTVEDVTIDAAGSLFATGNIFTGTAVTFGPYTLTAAASRDTYLAKLTNAGSLLAVRQPAAAPALAVWPTPTATGTAATLRLPAPTASPLALTLHDALGRMAATATVPAGRQEASLPTVGLAPGLYLLEAGLSRTTVVVE